MITDLAHLAFRVHDLDASLAFYARLGIHEAFRIHHDDGTLMLVYLYVAGDRFIELFPAEDAPAPAQDDASPSSSFGQPTGYFHLCLRSDDLRGDVEALRAGGVPILIEPQVGKDHNLQAWIRDADGHLIELMQLSEDSPQRRIARGER